MRYLTLLLVALACGSTPIAPSSTPGRIVLFGDSNTEGGWNAAGAEVEWGYISAERPATPASAPNGTHELAGKLDHSFALVVNHGASGRTTAQALATWQGLNHFEAEVLGLGKPWGGQDANPRVLAFTPTRNDYVYVSLGTNDWSNPYYIKSDSTIKNLGWMVERWINSGLPASHFIITTLPPRTALDYGQEIPALNPKIRGLASRYNLSLIDLSAYTSSDDGNTWRAPRFNVGDGTHYSEFVRDWLAHSIIEITRQ